ncbi:60S acidic ribosomal protein P2 like [Verticillium longisporum]|nr:60S acidic ribosomal protein P2 like [Verticillium longisporum]
MTNCVAGAYISAQLAVKLIDLSCSLPRPSTQIQDEAPRGLPPPHPRLSLKGKDINELIAEGSNKLASVPSGGAGGAAPAAGGAAAAGGDAPAEEAKEEEKEESDDDMGFGLFD